MIRKEKTKYMTEKCIQVRNNGNKVWQILREVIPTKKGNKNGPVCHLDANQLNDYFVSEPQNIQNEFNNSYESTETKYTNSEFNIPLMTSDDITKYLSKADNFKASGYDKISVRILKSFCKALIPILLILFNLCITKSVFPTAWKIAKVTPLFKSGHKSDPKNYRPISVLPIISKILENHIFNKFYEFLSANSLIYDYQFGFRKKFSTNDSLLTIVNTIVNSLNSKQKCCLVTLDINKAFDTVSHSILFNKLYLNGCSLKTIKFFESYLCQRYQFVKTCKSFSGIKEFSIGTPQGAIISPLLFCLLMIYRNYHLTGNYIYMQTTLV